MMIKPSIHNLMRFAALSAVSSVMMLAPNMAKAQYLSVAATKESSAFQGWATAGLLVSNDGLTEDPPSSGQFRLATSWPGFQSNYGSNGEPNDNTPLVHFDFGAVKTVDSFRVWNANEPGYTFRGFKDVTIQYSDNGTVWKTVPERYVFAQGPGSNNYFGEAKTLARPITARFIRFCCNSTYAGGYFDIASLGKVRFHEGGVPTASPAEESRYPLGAHVVDVTEAPYFAKGDGVADDTAAIQQAILDTEGKDQTVYLPAGTYLVSNTLKYSTNQSFNSYRGFGNNHIAGDGSELTIIKLKNNTFTNGLAPKPVLSTGFITFFNWQTQQEQPRADWFNNTVDGIGINVGTNNPGAKGVEFYTNNVGSIRDVAIWSEDGQGEVGLDLGHTDLNGPLLAKNISVSGFKYGVKTGYTVNSQTLEGLFLDGQTVAGFKNDGQCVTLRSFETTGTVPMFQNTYGFAFLMDGEISGYGAASSVAAITNGEYLVGRSITQTGYASTVQNGYGNGGNFGGGILTQYLSDGQPLSLFPTNNQFLQLPVKETPALPTTPVSQWVNARDYRLTDEIDDAPGVQRAIDSGAKVVYWPNDARIILKSNVRFNNNVQMFVGFERPATILNNAQFFVDPANVNRIAFKGSRFIGITNTTNRRMTVLDWEGYDSIGIKMGSGDNYLENVVSEITLSTGNLWARQLNVENAGTKLVNPGGKLWVLGYKTERDGTVVDTLAGGKSEILGGLVYTTTNATVPLFKVKDGSLGASIAEVAYGPTPYQTLLNETRGSDNRSLLRGQAPLRFSFMNGSALPLLRAGN